MHNVQIAWANRLVDPSGRRRCGASGRAVVALVGLLAAVGHPAAAPTPVTRPSHRPDPVAHVDLTRYCGRWYEVSRIPNRFQRGCARGTTATYTLRDDGTLEVLNRCIQADGAAVDARGTARVVDATTNARLKVSFVRFLGRWMFWGDYWVLGLGPEYEYAVVGTPDRRYGWVLARTLPLTPEHQVEIDGILRAQGYDPERFQPSKP